MMRNARRRRQPVDMVILMGHQCNIKGLQCKPSRSILEVSMLLRGSALWASRMQPRCSAEGGSYPRCLAEGAKPNQLTLTRTAGPDTRPDRGRLAHPQRITPQPILPVTSIRWAVAGTRNLHTVSVPRKCMAVGTKNLHTTSVERSHMTSLIQPTDKLK